MCSNNLSECVGEDREGGLSENATKKLKLLPPKRGGDNNMLDSILTKKYLASDEDMCLDIAMTNDQGNVSDEMKVRTGRRPNPAIDGPRRSTVCMMLSEGEKFAVDRLALCMSITRSGLLADIVADFVFAAEGTKQAREAEKRLLARLRECRKGIKKNGDFAAKTLQAMKGKSE
jgi:hypothetical protein